MAASPTLPTAVRPPATVTAGVGRELSDFKKIFRDLRLHVDVGVRLHHARRTDSDRRFSDVFEALNTLLPSVEEYQKKLSEGAPRFDFVNLDGSQVKANGYRSILHLLRCCLVELHSCLQECAKKRSSVFYHAVDHLSNIVAYSRALQGLDMMCGNAITLLEASEPQVLFHEGDLCQALKRFACSEHMNRDVFYGRCLGMQYPSTMKPVLKMIAIAMASYERWYSADKDDPVRQLLQSLWKGSKYWNSPSQMGLKLDALTLNCSVYFTKAFWSIVEQDAVKAAMTLISRSVEINQYMEVPAKHLTMQGSKGEVTLSPPFSDIGYKPIPFLLLSYKWRAGQARSQPSKKQPCPPATGLLVHIHGGGYVAQSPKYHESYLRGWSKDLDVPIVSIAYSLAPEAPYPRALDECVFVYVWLLQNLELLGTTGEQIVFVGDSAGGNFVITATMKLKELGLRLPDRIVSCYPTLNATSSVSPSRFMTLTDPILPLGVLLSCQSAYCGCVPSEEVLKMRTEARNQILRSKGIYVPEADAKTPPISTKRKKPTLSKKDSKKSSADGVDEKDYEGSGKKTPPPRPPPPTPTSSIAMATIEAPARPRPPKPRPPPTSSLPDVPEGELIELGEVGETSQVSQESVSGGGAEEDTPSLQHVSGGSADEDTPLLRLVDLQGYNGDRSSEQTGTGAGTGAEGGEEREGTEEVDWSVRTVAVTSVELSVIHRRNSSINYHYHRRTEEKDKLTADQTEELLQKVLQSLDDPPVTRDPYMSPTLAPDELLTGLPPIHIVACSLDPLLDESITMAQRLKAVGGPVTLNVMENLPHGFLCIYSAGNDPDLQAAFKIIVSYLTQGLSNTKKL